MLLPIQDMVEIRAGYQVREGLKRDPSGTYLVVQTKDIDEENGRLLAGTLDRFTPPQDVSSYVIQNGDVLFLSKGRRRYATLVEELPSSPGTIPLYNFFVLRPRTEVVDPPFLVWVLNEPEAQEYLNGVASGTTVPFVTKQSFVRLKVDVPAMHVQRSIGDLHRLANRERLLARKLEVQRYDYIHSVCRILYKRGEG